MATVVKQYIGDDGTILMPMSFSLTNTANLLSDDGTVFFAQTYEVVAIEAGNPMGLLLTLTYPSTP